MKNISKESSDNWQQDPNNWVYGIFYYNPVDKRIFPPKRQGGLGWTINFANSRSILSFVAVVFTIILLTILYIIYYEN